MSFSKSGFSSRLRRASIHFSPRSRRCNEDISSSEMDKRLVSKDTVKPSIQKSKSMFLPPFVNPIDPDHEDFKDLFYALGEESIFYRFLTPLIQIQRQTLQDFYYVDQESDISIVAVLGENVDSDSEKIVAAGRYLLDPLTNQAEFALVVQDGYQNIGIGTFLLNHLMRIAKSKGVRSFVAYVHPSNVPMINFIHKTGKMIESKLSIEDNQYTFLLRL